MTWHTFTAWWFALTWPVIATLAARLAVRSAHTARRLRARATPKPEAVRDRFERCDGVHEVGRVPTPGEEIKCLRCGALLRAGADGVRGAGGDRRVWPMTDEQVAEFVALANGKRQPRA